MNNLTEIFKYLVDKRRQAVVIAGIGQGKTYASIQIAKTLIEKYKGKVIYISHYLVSQSKFVKEFEEHGITPLVYNSKLSKEEKQKILSTKTGFIVCTVEALMTHLNRLLDNCILVIFDEIHLISEETYREKYRLVENLIEECRNRNIAFIGLTATWNYQLQLPVYDTHLKSKINVKNWYFTQIRSEYLRVANHKKSNVIGGYIARLLDKTSSFVDKNNTTYDHVYIYCNNKHIGLKLQKLYPDLKIICSDIRNAFYDYLYNGSYSNETFVYDHVIYDNVISDNLADYPLVFATESICNGLNFNSVKGKVLCIVVVDGTNSILNAIQFVGRFRKAEQIDVIQLTIPTKTPKACRNQWTRKWEQVNAFYRRFDVMHKMVQEQYPDVQIHLLDLTNVEPKQLPSIRVGILKRFFRIAKKFGTKITKRFLQLILDMQLVLASNKQKQQRQRQIQKQKQKQNLITLLFYALLQCKGRRVKSRKAEYKDLELYSIDNAIRDQFLAEFKMLYTRGIKGIRYMYNENNGRTVYCVDISLSTNINVNINRSSVYGLLLQVIGIIGISKTGISKTGIGKTGKFRLGTSKVLTAIKNVGVSGNVNNNGNKGRDIGVDIGMDKLTNVVSQYGYAWLCTISCSGVYWYT